MVYLLVAFEKGFLSLDGLKEKVFVFLDMIPKTELAIQQPQSS